MPWGNDSNRIVPSDWKTRKARVLRDHGRICHDCRHPDADEVDHLINVAEWVRQQLPGSAHDYANLVPIHGDYCPTCDQRCHKNKTAQESATARARSRQRGQHPRERHPGLD
jgi:5-methylcytosine-specific restriction endonuclease McrA